MKAYSVLHDYSKEACNLLRASGIEVVLADANSRPNEDELIELAQKYDILIIGAKEKMTQRVFKACTCTKIIGTLSVGLDHISSDFMLSNDIKIINCPTSNVVSVAEHTFALLLSLKKKILPGNKSSMNGSGRSGIIGLPQDISGLVMGVVGAGRIASEVIKISQAFRLNILCNTRCPQKHTDLIQYGVQFVGLDELLSSSDIVTVHLPLTNQTRGIISAEKINLMKKSSIFLNTSRAELVDMPHLISRIDECQNFLVGMDIDIDGYHDLFTVERDNLIVTPHIAGISIDAINRMDIDLANYLINMTKEL